MHQDPWTLGKTLKDLILFLATQILSLRGPTSLLGQEPCMNNQIKYMLKILDREGPVDQYPWVQGLILHCNFFGRVRLLNGQSLNMNQLLDRLETLQLPPNRKYIMLSEAFHILKNSPVHGQRLLFQMFLMIPSNHWLHTNLFDQEVQLFTGLTQVLCLRMALLFRLRPMIQDLVQKQRIEGLLTLKDPGPEMISLLEDLAQTPREKDLLKQEMQQLPYSRLCFCCAFSQEYSRRFR